MGSPSPKEGSSSGLWDPERDPLVTKFSFPSAVKRRNKQEEKRALERRLSSGVHGSWCSEHRKGLWSHIAHGLKIDSVCPRVRFAWVGLASLSLSYIIREMDLDIEDIDS